MIRKFFSFLFLFTTLSSSAFSAEPVPNLIIKSGKTSHKFVVEVADDDVKREQGLMFRKKLANDGGMLFIFRRENIENFWMKNTLIPLDILFITADNKITKIHKMAKPHDQTLISSEVPVLKALELRAAKPKKGA